MIFLIVLLLLIILAYLSMTANVQKLKNRPVKYPYEVLSQEPKGEVKFITQSDGAKIKTISAGRGRTIIFAHGYGASALEWNVIGDQLVKEGYRIIAFDQLGHGESTIGTSGITSQTMAGAYKSVLEHYNVENGVLVGHSMGGFLSFVYMLTYPEGTAKHLKSAMIMASFAGDIMRDNPQNKMQIPMITSGIMKKIAETEILGYPFAKSLIGDEPDSAIIDAFLSVFKNVNHEPLIPILKAFGAENNYDRLNEIKIPCTIIVGTKDKTTPLFHTTDMANNIPQNKVVRLEGKGHMLNWEAVEELLTEIKLLA